MKVYVEKRSILLEEESEVEKNQTKEYQMSKKDVLTLLTTEEEVNPRNIKERNEDRKRQLHLVKKVEVEFGDTFRQYR